MVRLNEEKARPEIRVSSGDLISAHPGLAGLEPSPDADAGPNRVPRDLDVLLETPDLLFVDKKAGVLVHGGDASLETDVRAYLSGRIGNSLSFSPGPLHRLDRNTSGALAFSKSIQGARSFSQALRDGLVRKTYLAILEGRLDSPRRWEDRLERDSISHTTTALRSEEEGGKVSSLILQPLASGSGFSFVALRLETGRTHQIRAQAAGRGFPLHGDVKYGGSRASLPYWLHAWSLSCPAGMIGGSKSDTDSVVEIRAPLPGYFFDFLESRLSLRKKEVYSILDGVFV